MEKCLTCKCKLRGDAQEYKGCCTYSCWKKLREKQRQHEKLAGVKLYYKFDDYDFTYFVEKDLVNKAIYIMIEDRYMDSDYDEKYLEEKLASYFYKDAQKEYYRQQEEYRKNRDVM